MLWWLLGLDSSKKIKESNEMITYFQQLKNLKVSMKLIKINFHSTFDDFFGFVENNAMKPIENLMDV